MTIKRCYPVLVGASVAENQQLEGMSSDNWQAVTKNNGTVVFSNGECSYTVVTAGNGYKYGIVRKASATYGVIGHKFLAVIEAKSANTAITIGGDICNVGFTFSGALTTAYKTYEVIVNATGKQPAYFCVRGGSAVDDVINFRNAMLIDLTLLLGSAIADRAYTLEQQTAGSGIAWLRSYGFLGGYVPYNSGTIESVEATAKVVRDENGENAVTYPLGSDVLRGIFKLANGKLYADGDRKEADGTITRRYKMIDLGTLAFNNSNPSLHIFRAELNDAKMASDVQSQQYDPVNALMSNGYQVMGFIPISPNDDKRFAIGFRPDGAKQFSVIANDYDSVSAFTQAMSGVYLVYELETPTTEQSTPFTSPQICYPDGTEEYVTNNGVPVGHETKYQL